MSRTSKPRVRRTPRGLHLYRATMSGFGCYGWGNTPDEARERLTKNMAAELADREEEKLRRGR